MKKKDFCITHFFNPVRYMGLLEIVKNENNDLNKINDLKKFCEVELGKGAIVCNDTPGFFRQSCRCLCNANCNDRKHLK